MPKRRVVLPYFYIAGKAKSRYCKVNPYCVPERKGKFRHCNLLRYSPDEKSKQMEGSSRWVKSYHCGRAKLSEALHIEDGARVRQVRMTCPRNAAS
jgi:hypothetical protein